MDVCKLTIYANCDIETAEPIVRNAFKPYQIEVDIESVDVSAVASLLGKLGGSSTSNRKSDSSRKNGRKGGRPRNKNSV